jgi:hypothetical protein
VPFNFNLDPQQFGGTMTAVISIITGIVTALSIAMVIWTYRDMKSRSRDAIVQVLAALVVALLNVPGLLTYLILRPRETLSEQYQRALEEEALLQAIEEKATCPGCGHPIRDLWRLCPFCHTKLKKSCANCNQLLDLPWTVCPYCEHPQGDVSYQSRRSEANNPNSSVFDSSAVTADAAHDET